MANKLKYSFDDYIKNPSGRGSAVNTSVDKLQYDKELLSLEGNNGKATYTVYKQGRTGGVYYYIIHFAIPSSTKGFFHDVVIEFNPDQLDNVGVKSIKAYTVKFFVNDENFVYTYAYAFKTHGLLISELERLLPFRSITQKAPTRNPDNAMGYNKQLVYAYLIMQRHNLFSKDILNRICNNTGYNVIRQKIEPFDKKVQERRKLTQKEKEAADKVRRDKSNTTKIVKSKNLLGNSLPTPPKLTTIVNQVKSVSKIGTVKKKPKKH